MAQSLELTAGPWVSPICHTSEECPSHDVPGMRRHRNQIALFVSRSLNNPLSGFPEHHHRFGADTLRTQLIYNGVHIDSHQ
ncbi:MAG: hypothetical protein MK524_04520 [SAR202 cluster bacterium]|nr:hypothetical protein [SAR202 cluster bacterium]